MYVYSDFEKGELGVTKIISIKRAISSHMRRFIDQENHTSYGHNLLSECTEMELFIDHGESLAPPDLLLLLFFRYHICLHEILAPVLRKFFSAPQYSNQQRS